MTRTSSLGLPNLLVLAAVSICFTPSSATGQALPISRGATVRVARADAESSLVWSTGRVVYASRDSLLLAETDGDRLVRYNEALRVQIQKQQNIVVVGGAIGLIAGGVAGWYSSSAFTESQNRDAAKVASTVIFGVTGLAMGAIIGSRIHRTAWRDVQVELPDRSIASLSGDNTDREFTLSRTVRWTKFEPTVADFEAFFLAHADSLDPVEGIWARHGTNVGIAIVRVAGTNAEQFAAYSLNQYPGRPRQPRDGVLLFVLNRTNDEYAWEFQLARATPRRFTAQVFPDLIELWYPTNSGVDRWIDRWEKLLPED